jgi:pimeloyl-ACP methyl ester carboxylesterase
MSQAPVVLIHGLWLTPHSWRGWVDRYTRLGHQVYAPAWPGVSEFDDPLDHDKAPADIGVREVADHYEAFVRELPEPPLLIGHSFGGLVVQILLDRGVGAAGVAIHSAQPRGVRRLPPSVLRATWPVLRNPANLHRAVPLTDKQFHYAFANTVSARQAAAERARWAIPAPGRPLFQAALANATPPASAATRVDFGNERRAPLLLVAGTADHIVPPAIVKENFDRYAGSRAITQFEEFPGRDHFTAGLDGWQDVADHALTWAVKQAEAADRRAMS